MRVHRLVLTLAASAVATGGLLIGGAASAQTSFGGCLLPTAAATAFTTDWNGDFPDAFSEKDCKKQCTQLDKGCKAAASSANQCTKNAGNAFFNSQKAFCNGLENKDDRKSCNESNNSIKQTQKGLLKDNNSTAKQGCKAAKEVCVTSCGLS